MADAELRRLATIAGRAAARRLQARWPSLTFRQQLLLREAAEEAADLRIRSYPLPSWQKKPPTGLVSYTVEWLKGYGKRLPDDPVISSLLKESPYDPTDPSPAGLLFHQREPREVADLPDPVDVERMHRARTAMQQLAREIEHVAGGLPSPSRRHLDPAKIAVILLGTFTMPTPTLLPAHPHIPTAVVRTMAAQPEHGIPKLDMAPLRYAQLSAAFELPKNNQTLNRWTRAHLLPALEAMQLQDEVQAKFHNLFVRWLKEGLAGDTTTHTRANTRVDAQANTRVETEPNVEDAIDDVDDDVEDDVEDDLEYDVEDIDDDIWAEADEESYR